MTQATRPRRIMSDALWPALINAGLFHDDDSVRRIVIDAQTGEPVIIYVELWGDERLLDVVPTLDGVEIRGVPAPTSVSDDLDR